MSTKRDITVQTYGKGRYFDANGNPLDEVVCDAIDARIYGAQIAAAWARPDLTSAEKQEETSNIMSAARWRAFPKFA